VTNVRETKHTLRHGVVWLAALVGVVSSGTGCHALRARPLPPPPTYACAFTDREPRIDGRLDEPAWAAAAWTTPFVDIEGDARPRPPLRTRAKMLWDDEYFYIGAELEEPHVWATLTQRDAIVFQDPDFEVFIDPDGDRATYFELEFNALNTVFDLFLVKTYLDGGPALHGWDCHGLRSAVHVDGTLNDATDTDRGWSVEIAIPWTALCEAAPRPCPPAPGSVWRVDFSRVEWQTQIVNGHTEKVAGRPEDNWVWAPQGVVNMHLPEHWGYVRFERPGR
jgi:hypothetical protein